MPRTMLSVARSDLRVVACVMIALSMVAAGDASAVRATVLDCALRDAPFSVDSPLIDVLLSKSAGKVIEREVPQFANLPPDLKQTATPSFAAIMTLREVAPMVGIDDGQLNAVDGKLAALAQGGADSILAVVSSDGSRSLARRPRAPEAPRRMERQAIRERDGGEMSVGFHELVAHAAGTRALCAGTIIGSGTVANADYREVGSSCISERRGIELIDRGKATTPFMSFGDTVSMDARLADGRSVFGAIEQRVVRATLPRRRGRHGRVALPKSPGNSK